MKKVSVKKKDKFYAKIAFFLSLGFWVPLFNIGLCITSMILAFLALKKHYREPERFGGIGYIVIALILSISSIILSIIGLILYLSSERICTSALCRLNQ